MYDLENKRILITAGPTWVAIDSVRVISNIATGETGIILAQKLQKLGFKVTLLLGPVGFCHLNKNIRILRFRYFEELEAVLKEELVPGKYSAVVHSAAVSDYQPKRTLDHKIASGIKSLKINLVPTQKLIDLIRRLDRDLFLIGFKFIPQVKKEWLFKEAKHLMLRAGLDAVVANTVDNKGYRAYIVNTDAASEPLLNKKSMVIYLAALIVSRLREVP